MRIDLKLFLVICFFLPVIFLRFYNLRKNVSFNWDQEITAQQVRFMVINHKPILIGIRIGPAKFFLPPLYYYLAAPFLIITKFDPIGLYYFSGILGLMTGVSIYYFSKKILSDSNNSKNIAFITSLIYLISPSFLVFDRAPTGLNLLIIPTFITFVSLINITDNQKRFRDYLLLGIGIGLGLNAHFTAVFLIIISLLWLMYKKKLSYKLIITFLMILLFISPLIIFDLRHQFFNTRAFFEFFQGNKETLSITLPLILSRWAKNIFIIMELWGTMAVGNIAFWGKSVIGFALLVFLLQRVVLVKNRIKSIYLLGILFLFVSSFLFTFYNGAIPEYYFLIITPLFLLSLSDFIYRELDKNKTNIFLALLGLMSLVIYDFAVIKTNIGDSLFNKQQAIASIKDNPAKITYAMSSLGQNFGYSYLLNLRNISVDENAKTEYIIKFPISQDLRRNDYIKYGEIGVKRKELVYDNYYLDYFNHDYLFAFDLPIEWNIIECSFENNLHEYLIIDKKRGSCLDPVLEAAVQIHFWMGDDKKIANLYKSFEGEEFQLVKPDLRYILGKKQSTKTIIKDLFVIPRQNDKSLLVEFKREDANHLLNDKFKQLMLSLKTYDS